jgi:hypothetical protein
MGFSTFAATVLISFWASQALAFFGTDLNLKCASVKTCEGNGDCLPIDLTVEFNLEHIPPPYPEGTSSWPVRITVDGMKHNADMFTESGPVVWSGAGTGNFLYLVPGEHGGLVWQRSNFVANTGELIFMQCEAIDP